MLLSWLSKPAVFGTTTLLLSGCALLSKPPEKPVVVYQTVLGECPEYPALPPEVLSDPVAPGYFLNEAQRILFDSGNEPNSSTPSSLPAGLLLPNEINEPTR